VLRARGGAPTLKFKPSDSDKGLQMPSRAAEFYSPFDPETSPRQTCAYYVARADSVSKT
jgi:hypothetical protein